MGKNKGQETVQMYRWDQYLERWIPYTSSVNEKGQTVVSDPLPKSGLNPITILHKNAAGSTVRIEKIINGFSYSKTIEESDMIEASSQTISAWT